MFLYGTEVCYSLLCSECLAIVDNGSVNQSETSPNTCCKLTNCLVIIVS